MNPVLSASFVPFVRSGLPLSALHPIIRMKLRITFDVEHETSRSLLSVRALVKWISRKANKSI